MIKKPTDSALIRHFLIEHPGIDLMEGAPPTGKNHREHPRFNLRHAPLYNNAEIPFRLGDLSVAGCSFVTENYLARETRLIFQGGALEERPALVVACRALSPESGLLIKQFRHQVHCQFVEEMDAELFGRVMKTIHHVEIRLAE